MFKTVAAIAMTAIGAIIVTSALTTSAEAGGGHGFYTSYFYRMQGRPKPVDPSAERRKREAEAFAERARIRRLEAQRAAALRQAAARRARLLEQQREAAAKADAAKDAKTTATVASPSVATPVVAGASTTEAASTGAAKKGDLLTSTVKPATDDQGHACRKYSAAANAIVDGPCE